MEAEGTEGLDDLRKKRLAYYGTCDKPPSSQLIDQQASDRQSLQHPVKENTAEPHSNATTKFNSELKLKTENTFKNDFHLEHSKGVTETLGSEQHHSYNNEKCHKTFTENNAHNNKKTSSQPPLTTSSFYLTNPAKEASSSSGETDSKPKKSDPDVNTPQAKLRDSAPSPYRTETTPTPYSQPANNEQLDGYNETVERLIRATKEELMGLKPNDDIWSRIKRESVSESTSDLFDNHGKKDGAVTEYDNVNKKVETDEIPSSEISPQFSSKNHSGLFFESAHSTEGHSHPTVYHRSLSSSFKAEPVHSKFEPTMHHSNGTPSDLPPQKSFNTAKVEEIFSSRQLPREHLNGVTHVADSQEIEPLKINKSVENFEDLSELGLSTHRPENDNKDDLWIAAEELNLGDQVTQELRTVLGDEKFQEFIHKAKRDIDDLHERSSESSARNDKTPRLFKETPVNVDRPVSNGQNESKPLQRKHKKSSKETQVQASAEDLKQSKHTGTRGSQDFTPRRKDADVVQSLIGEHLKSEVSSKKQNQSAGNGLKNEKDEEDNMKTKDVKMNEPSVPSLNLGADNESPRPKLNRPKHEPPTIYSQERSVERNGKPERQSSAEKRRRSEMLNSGDARLRQSSYEQVTVPRNVAFSADEIYNQAYGLGYQGQTGPPSSPHIPSSFAGPGPYTGMQTMPLTPTTPVGQSPVAQSFSFAHVNQGSQAPVAYNLSASYSQYKGHAVRPSSYPAEGTTIPQPPSAPRPPAYDQIYSGTASSGTRFPGPSPAAMEQALCAPHPPANQPPAHHAVHPHGVHPHVNVAGPPHVNQGAHLSLATHTQNLSYPQPVHTTAMPNHTVPYSTMLSGHTAPYSTMLSGHTAPYSTVMSGHTAPYSTAMPNHTVDPTAPYSSVTPSHTAHYSTVMQGYSAPNSSDMPIHTAPYNTMMSSHTGPYTTAIPSYTAPYSTMVPDHTAPYSSVTLSHTTPYPTVMQGHTAPYSMEMPTHLNSPYQYTNGDIPLQQSASAMTPVQQQPVVPVMSTSIHGSQPRASSYSPEENIVKTAPIIQNYSSNTTSASSVTVPVSAFEQNPVDFNVSTSVPNQKPTVGDLRPPTVPASISAYSHNDRKKDEWRLENLRKDLENHNNQKQEGSHAGSEVTSIWTKREDIPGTKSEGSRKDNVGHDNEPSDACWDTEHGGKHSSPPPTPSTSEIQTERLDSPAADDNNDKVTLVEESTFTSVSQIHEEEKFMPHPPRKGKEGLTRPSPRRHHWTGDTNDRTTQDSLRHVEGIRHHHEQRRQQQEEHLSEKQLIDRQRRFARASIDRYFSSLENINSPSTSQQKVSDFDRDAVLHEEPGDLELESLTSDRNYTGNDIITKTDDVTRAPVEVIDDVTSTAFTTDFTKRDTEEEQFEKKPSEVNNNDNFNFVVPGFMDFSEKAAENESRKYSQIKFVGLSQDSEINKDGSDEQTVVNSEANTDMTLKAGGLTDRLNDLGINVKHRHANSDNKLSDKKGGKKGKVLIVCPECKALNKEYMSWCTKCGEMIIGVEPVLVSKNKEGKIRTKPLENNDVSSKGTEIHIEDPTLIMEPKTCEVTVGKVNGNYEQETFEKPFTLNLDGIKSPDKETFDYNDSKKVSPVKSDGKDSGRPSSDDHDLEAQTQKIEEEVVNDICASIADPVLKGYVRSHFSKSKIHSNKDGEHVQVDKTHNDNVTMVTTDERNRQEMELFKDLGLEMESKSFVKARKAQQVCSNVASSGEPLDDHLTESVITGDNVKSKIAIYNQKNLDVQNSNNKNKLPVKSETLNDWTVKSESERQLVPPPLPSFSSAPPQLHNELALKLPAHSLDYSTDMSQVISHNFETVPNEHDKAGHGVEASTEGRAGDSKMSKEERRKEKRRKRGHGAIDVEIFGYEESRESRNSSRANRMVPMLNLGGNSSDDDDSVHSDAKPVNKQEVKPVFKQEVKPISKQEIKPVKPKPVSQPTASMNAWEPDINSGVQDNVFPWQQGNVAKQPDGNGLKSGEKEEELLLAAGQSNTGVQHSAEIHIDSPLTSPDASTAVGVHRVTQEPHEGPEEWQRLFDELAADEEAEDNEEGELEEEAELSNQPFLEQLINQPILPKPVKSKKRPKSAGKPVKSRVRQSIEEPGYQRKWARSSTAWSSYNAGELSTSSSLRASTSDLSRKRPVSAPKARTQVSQELTASSGFRQTDGQLSQREESARVPSPVRQTVGQRTRPASADVYNRKSPKRKSKKGNLDDSIDLDLDSTMVEHRLPKPSMLERLHDNMASPRSTYDKYIEMTPRIEAGVCSRWQCLPDEILLHIFAYLDQGSITKVAQVCRQFYRVAMDETLWKYITIKKQDLDDDRLGEISQRHPTSLALIQCYGDRVTAQGLRNLFRESAPTLKELNIARCSRGALQGDSLLLHAAARCTNITHLDTSWCHVTDSGLMAISNTVHRLESLCINGCSSVTNDGLETVIKKHGASLRVLEMFGCFNLSPRGLRSVASNCVNLLSLNLGQCSKITDSCVSQLSTTLGRVESLDLRGCKQIKDNCVRRIVKNCTRLKNLSLAHCPSITDVSILEISTYLTDIRSLDVCGCTQIKDGSIRALVNTCTNLRHIDISSTGCTHRSVSMIANFSGQRLETLKINFLTDVTEQSLIKLARHCRRLTSVHMYGCTSVRNIDKVRDERPSFAIEM